MHGQAITFLRGGAATIDVAHVTGYGYRASLHETYSPPAFGR